MKIKAIAMGGLLAVSMMATPAFAELVMHLDADTLGLSDGASVATWTDQTANGNDAVQGANGGTAPTYVASNAGFNDHATVSFNGFSDYMDLDGSMITVDSFTLFIVGNFDVVAGINQYIISGQGGAGDDRLRIATYSWSGDDGRFRVGNSADGNGSLGAVGTNVHVYAVTGTADAWLDLGAKVTAVNTAGALNPSHFALGCYNDATAPRDFFGGDLAEVRLYNEILSDVAIETINEELFVAYNAEIPIAVEAEYPAPDADLTTNDFPLVLGGVLVDGSSAVDTSSIQLILDSNPVTLVSGDVVKTATTTTVSHAVSSLDLGSHTVSLVYEGTSPASGPFTNTWSFFVAGDSGNRVYVDAAAENTMQWVDGAFSAITPDGTGSNWTTRTGYGNGSTVFQSQYVSNSPMLKTTVSGLASGTYRVYAYMWAAGNVQQWRMAASTNNTDLTLYYQYDYPAATNLYVHYQDAEGADPWGNFTSVALFESTSLISNPFGTQAVRLANADRRLVEIFLGTVTGSEITVYVDDDPFGVVAEARSWYDGIGYELIGGGGPTVIPDIQSINFAGSAVTLQWASETGVTYSILHKDDLQGATWTPVKSGIAGGDPTTSDWVPVSGSDQEFFRIEGE